MKIAFVVSGNGYGHLKRVCTVVEEIFKVDPKAEVTTIGAVMHDTMLRAWGYAEAFKPFKFIFINGGLEKNLKASIDPAYTFNAYQDSWQQPVDALRSFEPDRVISDNLAGILAYYPRAMLMGSFLWSDTLSKKYKAHKELGKICQYEVELLEKHRPVMLGVQDMAMPNVKITTHFIGLPWFCTPIATETPETCTNTVLITGGGTDNTRRQLLIIARTLLHSEKFTVLLDNSLYDSLFSNERSLFSLFDFSDQKFRTLCWIICRPGIGILTDAIHYGVPLCAVIDDDPEMKFNGVRVEVLGMGILASQNYTEVPGQLTYANRNAYISKLRLLKTGGAALAADYILNS